MRYSPASEATQTGDYVGVESCIDLRNEEDFEAYARDCERSYERRRMMRKAELKVVEDRRRQVREFPPPITCLARTENQPSHMPWVMKRYYTTDGRLVIREEKVKHHEYFRAHRADGRLTLQLIPLDCDYDDDVEDGCSVTAVDDVQSGTDLAVDGCRISEFKNDAVNEGEDEKEDEEKNEDESVEKVEEKAVGDGMGGDETMMPAPVMVSSMSMSSLCITEGVNTRGESGGGSRGLLASASFSSLAASGGGGGGVNKCYGFNSLRSSSASSLFHLQVPAIRPVIS
ncbi:hypothetical protein QQ045_013072 [Rhodiola kirilowii]